MRVAPVGIDRDVALASDDLLGGVVTSRLGSRGLDRLAVDHRRRGTRLAPSPLTINHQRHIVDGLEQEAPRQLPEPTVDRLPRAKVDRQHPPAATRTDQVTDRVDHLPELDLPRTTAS